MSRRCVRIESPWLSKTDAASYLHMDLSKLNRLIDAGVIPAYQADRMGPHGEPVVYMDVEELDAYMRSRPYKPKAAPVQPARGPRKPRSRAVPAARTKEEVERLRERTLKELFG